jgi:hypothetical protein
MNKYISIIFCGLFFLSTCNIQYCGSFKSKIKITIFIKINHNMEELIHYFETIPSLHRSAILVGGLTFFWLLEGALPLYKFG